MMMCVWVCWCVIKTGSLLFSPAVVADPKSLPQQQSVMPIYQPELIDQHYSFSAPPHQQQDLIYCQESVLPVQYDHQQQSSVQGSKSVYISQGNDYTVFTDAYL